MATIKYEHLSDFIRTQGLLSWSIQTGKESNTTIFRTDESRDQDKNIEIMDSIMMNVTGDYFHFRGVNKVVPNDKGINSGFTSIEVIRGRSEKPKPQEAATPQYVSGVAGYIPLDEFERRIDFIKKEIKLEYREQEIEKKQQTLNEELRDFDSRQNDTIGMIVQKVGEILPYFFPKPASPTQLAQVAGVENIPDDKLPDLEITDDTEARASELLNRWMAADPDWLRLLETIVVLAESKDSKYTMAKSFL